MNGILVGVFLLTTYSLTVDCTWTGDYIKLGKPCDPDQQNGGVASSQEPGKVCYFGSKCNPKLKICDCSDSSDGTWNRTFQRGECRLLPGSTCMQYVDQEYYRCVDNSTCTVTRQGEDVSKCPEDASCDMGTSHCICDAGKTCLTESVSAEPL